MTIKWVQADPLVMNGEPFCYGSRITVRQLLELRRNGYTLTELIKDHPELKTMGIAAAYAYAADHRERYARVLRAQRLHRGTRPTPRRGRRPARPYRAPGHRGQTRPDPRRPAVQAPPTGHSAGLVIR